MQRARQKKSLNQGFDPKVMYQLVFLNPLTHRTPCFNFIPLFHRENQARMDYSTGKPALSVCSKLPQMFTAAEVIDIFVYLFKKQQGKNTKKKPLFKPISQMLQAG